MTAQTATDTLGAGKLVKKASGWYMAIAVIFIVLGVLAIAEPFVAGLVAARLVGWLFIFGGVAHFIAAFSGGGVGRVLWQLLLALVYLVGGGYLLSHPLLALGSLTLLLAAILLADAVVEIVAFFGTRKVGGSVWLLINGLVTLLLAFLIWDQWPSSAVWAIGTLVGLKLLMTGFSRLMLGSAVRRVASAI
jgi:uncharacterized membrane protein HdeD (DUF308 family)